ncbi:MAG: HAD family hydrolase [Thermoleophilia bacterium]
MLKAILWDNDGVLVDTEELYYEATRRVAAGAGVELTAAQFLEVSLTAGLSMFDILRERGFSGAEVDELRRRRNALYRSFLLAGVRVNAGVREALEELRGSYRMGVVTSSLREHFDAAHASTGLAGHFEFVVAREDYRESKPAPDPYLTALERHGLDPAECVAIEDTRRGLDSALAAGLSCLAVPTALTRDADFSGALAVLADTSEIVGAIRRL